MNKFLVVLFIILLLLSTVGLLGLKFLYDCNVANNAEFFNAYARNLISSAIGIIGIIINVCIAVGVAYYMTQQRGDLRKSKEHAEKMISDLKVSLRQLATTSASAGSEVASIELLLLCTSCENKLYSLREMSKKATGIQKYITGDICENMERCWID